MARAGVEGGEGSEGGADAAIKSPGDEPGRGGVILCPLLFCKIQSTSILFYHSDTALFVFEHTSHSASGQSYLIDFPWLLLLLLWQYEFSYLSGLTFSNANRFYRFSSCQSFAASGASWLSRYSSMCTSPVLPASIASINACAARTLDMSRS